MAASKNNTEGNINTTRRTIKKKISYNKYNQYLTSAVKGVTKEVSVQIFLGYSSEISPHLPLLLSFHVTTLFLHAHAVHIHTKYLKKGSFGKSISRQFYKKIKIKIK